MPEQSSQNAPDATVRAKTLGRFVPSEVVGSRPLGAYLKLDGIPEPGFLHVARENFDAQDDAPEFNVVLVGQTFTVQVTGYDELRGWWEVSRKAARLHEEWLVRGPTVGDSCSATVLRIAPPFGATMTLPNRMPAFSGIAKNPGLWELMITTGRLSTETVLRVRILGWDKRGRGISVGLDLGNPGQLEKESLHEAKIIHVVSRFKKKTGGEELRSILYGELATREIVHAYVNDYLFPEKHFGVGQKIAVRVTDRQSRNRFYFPLVPCEVVDASASEKKAFRIGEEVLGRIVKAVEAYAVCLISDGVRGLIHHSSIIREYDFDTRKYLHPGDWVRVRIISKRESRSSAGNVFYNLYFVALDLPGILSQDRDPLVDLSAVRQKGKTGGYRRDAEFRRTVLDAFDLVCCVCGEKYSVGTASPMEAAHIIPRSKRGAEVLANSLCFCPVHHWAFDRGFLTIDQDYIVKICSDVLSDKEGSSWLKEFEGANAHFPDCLKPDVKALFWHRENVFLG